MQKYLIHLAGAIGTAVIIFGSAACNDQQNRQAKTVPDSDRREAASQESLHQTSDSDSVLVEVPLKITQYKATSSKSLTTTDVQVVVHQVTDYATHEPMANEAASLLERVINTDRFRNLVLNDTYLNNRGLTNQQILDLILKAHEDDGPGGSDGTLDLRLRVITLKQDGQEWIDACTKWVNGRRTVGKDGGGSGVTATCLNYIETQVQNKTPYNLSGHYMHEYMHMLGFSHTGLGDRKEESVPYQIGEMARAVGEELLRPLSGTVLRDQRFQTTVDGQKRTLTVHASGMQERVPRLLDISKYVGKKIKIRVTDLTDADAYGAEVVK